MEKVKEPELTSGLLQRIARLPLWSLVVLAAVLYIPLAFLGYGSDSDSYNVVRTGQYFVETLDYIPSRLPGFFVHEVFVYFLNLAGGSLLSNLGTVAMALLMLVSFNHVCRNLQVPHFNLLTLIFMLHPFIWVNAASTIDYLWALGFAFLGFECLLRKKYIAAAIFLALSIGSRLSTVLIVGLFFLFTYIKMKDQRRNLFVTGFAVALFSFVLFIPALDFLEWDVSRWLVLSTGDPVLWTPLLRIGRFFYKNLMFWGIPAAMWLIYILFRGLLSGLSQAKKWDLLTWICLAVILACEVLFLKAPIEMEYLLPLLPFVLILLSKGYDRQPQNLLVLLVLVLLANFIWINPARSITPNQTSGVIYGLWVEKGYLLQDITTRLAILSP